MIQTESTGPAVSTLSGRGIPVRGNDIDTDQIIPARYMKVVTFEGLGQYAFYDVRFNEDGTQKPHPFNDPKYTGAGILLVNRNFGCGSSREHAPQALQKAGIKAVVGESFAEIFAGNCTAMGVPAVTLSADDMQEVIGGVEQDPQTEITLDLKSNTLTVGCKSYPFSLPPAYRNSLIAGTWDSTSVLLDNLEQIHLTAARLPYVDGFAQGA
ncbi:MAG: 3-isopropylmalate dehydratase small subunit [Spirochaetaceae bacterium]|nr:MAG: 3-isopropylmalate dehydratase small subunit [Spirochaetaceae bacterium]